MRKHFPTVRIIQNPKNDGFAGGYNEALAQVDAEYYILLNQDIEVSENWVEKVLVEMEKDKNIAAAQPKLRSYYQKDYFEYAGACGGYLDKYSYAFCRGRMYDVVEKDEGQYDTIAEIFWATGACMFIRSEVFWKAGAFDADFFAHQEEIDLCWRIKNLGYRIICVPQSVVYHVGGGSLSKTNPHKTFLNFRNNMRMMFKNMPIGGLLWKIPLRICLDTIAATYSVYKKGNLRDSFAIVRAHYAFIGSIPKWIKKRKGIPHSAAHLSNVNTIWEHFILRRRTFSDLKETVYS
jgi:GT2 family glycosyltransferase